VVSLGLISLILGFALQIPLTSFIGWIHIIITRPYKVGDRIKIGEAAGDVIDIGYLETTLWETIGEGLSSDHPSGRIIRFPNSTVLSNPVYNYSWPLFPYIWDEARFYIGFKSDYNFTSDIIKSVTEKEMGSDLSEKIHLYHELLKETPVEQKQVVEKPVVYFRVHNNMWMEATVRYLVEPKESGDLKNRLVEKIVNELTKHPEKVIIPMGAER
jgi:small-conductance mechanosensitive channel